MKSNMDTIYAMGILGAAFYYIKNAASFGDGIIGILKAIVWPAVIIFKIFEHMHW